MTNFGFIAGHRSYLLPHPGSYVQTKLSQQSRIADIGLTKGTWVEGSGWTALMRSASTSALKMASGKSL
jgi:hypothetical protein